MRTLAPGIGRAVYDCLILWLDGSRQELDAEFYQADGGDWVFMAAQREVLRVAVAGVTSIS